MITRRDMFFGGLLTVCWIASNSSSDGQFTPGSSIGCMLSSDDAERIFARGSEQQVFYSGNEPVIASSGNRDFDYALAQTLSKLVDLLDVSPGFAYFDDFEGPNAFATPRTRLERADGTVLFGKRLFVRTMSQLEFPDVAVSAICAHEFGHILQYKRGFSNTLVSGQSTVKRRELNADFFAGYYAGMRKLQKPDYPAAVFATQQHSAGGFRSNVPDFHGTPDERAAAVVRGFETAYRERRQLAEAIQIGINYVANL